MAAVIHRDTIHMLVRGSRCRSAKRRWANVTTVKAQVRSVQIPRSPRDLYHVGVELETPANVWRVPTPPPDWLTAAERLKAELPPSKEQTAAATGPGRAPTAEDIPPRPPAATHAESAAPSNGPRRDWPKTPVGSAGGIGSLDHHAFTCAANCCRGECGVRRCKL